MKKITFLFLFSIFAFSMQGQVYLPLESFDSGLGTWTVTDGGAATGDSWVSGLQDGVNSLNGSNCAFVDSDANGNGIQLLETLTSVAFDSSGGTVVLLQFDQYFRFLGPSDFGSVEVWDGAAWQQVLLNDATAGAFNAPDVQSIDISAYKNAAMQVRFVFDDADTWAWYWLIDNVKVIEQPLCTPPVATSTNVVDDCLAGTYTVDVDVTSLGDATSVTILNNGGVASTQIMSPTLVSVGPFAVSDVVLISLQHDQDNDCNVSLGSFSSSCPPDCPTTPTPADDAVDVAFVDGGVQLTWVPAATGAPADDYNIFFGDTSGALNDLGVLAGTTVLITGIDPSTEYFWSIVPNNAGGSGVGCAEWSFTTEAALPEACDGAFYDTGGPGAGYAASESVTTTILPDTAGDAVTITFTYVDIEAATGAGNQDGCWDFMTIYDGPDATSPVLAQTLCGEESGDLTVPSVASSELNIGDSFTSTHASGALTIVFSSDTSVQETGWIADITCNSLSTPSYTINELFSYYPNPVNDKLTLSAQNKIDAIVVNNMLGQEVLRTYPNSVENNLDMSSLQTGAYFVKVTIGNRSKTIRILKE